MSTAFAPGEHARPQWLREHPKAWLAVTATVCFGAFMGQLDASIVALTYNSIGTSFHSSLGVVQWVSLSYLITLSALLIPLGAVSDRLGRKRVYLWGFGAFTLASIGCGLAPNLLTLVLLRAVQGAGAAMLQANSIALIATSAPAQKLRTALGIQAAVQAIGLALGPTIGGLIVQTIGWRWVFAINLPIGAVAIGAGRYLLPRTRLTASPTDGNAARRLGQVLRVPDIRRNLVVAACAYLLLFGPIVLVPTVLQRAAITPLLAGLVVAALPIGFAAAASLADRVLPSGWSTDRRCGFGLWLSLLGLAVLITAAERIWLNALACGVLGLGLGVYVPANNAAIMRAVPNRVAAVAGGLLSTGRAVGTAAGTALVAGALAVSRSWLAATTLLVIAAAMLALTPPRRRMCGIWHSDSECQIPHVGR